MTEQLVLFWLFMEKKKTEQEAYILESKGSSKVVRYHMMGKIFCNGTIFPTPRHLDPHLLFPSNRISERPSVI